MKWWLVAAWALAALMCGVVLWPDTHFVIRVEERDFNGVYSFRCGCFGMTVELRERMPEPESVRDPPATDRVEARAITYAELKSHLAADPADLARRQGILVRMTRAGRALFGAALGAAVLGLLAIVWRGPSSLHHGALLVAALSPLAAIEYFGYTVHGLRGEMTWIGDSTLDFVTSVFATSTTWAARVAWGGLAVATAISWWRSRRATPVDPGVFE